MDTDPARPKLLVVEDDQGLCNQYRWAFAEFDVTFTSTRLQAQAAVGRIRPPVAVVDLGLPPDPDGVSEGLATIADILRIAPHTKVIVATSHGDRTYALQAISAGAYDFCEKFEEVELLRGVVQRALVLSDLEEENRRLNQVTAGTIRRIVTRDQAMLKVCRDVERLAPANVTVLLLGESGTGKEALASALHEFGSRAKKPFVAINCGAIPESAAGERAVRPRAGRLHRGGGPRDRQDRERQHGTLFLDEIGDLPLSLQVKLLRFLQEQVIERVGGRTPIPVDVRVVSATNLALDRLVAEGRFRTDLFYRLNPVTIRIPPLRDRPGDPLLLARMFLSRFNQEFGRSLRDFSPAARGAIEAYAWPGNVRELENRMKRAVLMAEGKLIEPADLELDDAEAEPTLDLRTIRLRAEREAVTRALARTGGKLTAAARLLGISRPTLYDLLETHGFPSRATPDGTGDQTANSTPT